MRVVGAAMERSSWAGCRRTGALLGLVFFHGVRRRHELATSNVRLAFPRLSEAAARRIACRAAQNLAMSFCEFLHLRTASAREVREYADIEGLEHIEAGFARGHGVILLTAHVGNWELMGARAAQDFPLTVVARPRSNSAVEKHITEVRRVSGIQVISKYDTGRAALKVLQANGALGILPDQHAGPEGLRMPMFGHPTRFAPSLARLAMMTGAPMVPSFGVRRTPWLADGRIVACVSPGIALPRDQGRYGRDFKAQREATILEGTTRVIHEIESIVRRHPDQWMWLHRRWRPEDADEMPDKEETSESGARDQ
jgi:Kdo2-lipid IVA lauroyltransferase/acyltransferase